MNEGPTIKIFSQDCSFIIGATNEQMLPDTELSEVAFIGRSNVGKSSLINSIVNRKDMARASNTPGRTKQLNFFNLANQVILVDLPGYGYAKAAKTEVRSWNKLLRKYLIGRVNLKRVFLLIDSRHGVKKNDIELMNLLDESAVTYQIILTKIDLIRKDELALRIKSIEELFLTHTALIHNIYFCSSKKTINIRDLQQEIINLIS